MWPPACPAVLSGAVPVGVATVLVALLDESEEQLTTVKTLAAASSGTRKRFMKTGNGWEIQAPKRPFELRLPLLPEHEAQRGSQLGIEQVGQPATAQPARGRRAGLLTATLNCGGGKIRKMGEGGAA